MELDIRKLAKQLLAGEIEIEEITGIMSTEQLKKLHSMINAIENGN